MKIKIGAMTEEIRRMSNEIFKNDSSARERISIELKDTTKTVAEIDELITQNFTGTIVLVDDDGVEESFIGYEFESARKNYDNMGKQMSLEFKVRKETE